MATEPVTILPMEATAKEVEEMTTVIKQAFGPDPLMEFLFNQPNVPKPPKEEALAKSLERMTNPLFVYHKAVDAVNPDGPILGVAVWYWVEDPQNSTKNIPWGDPAPDVHLGCYEATLGALRSWRLEHFREINQPFVNMALLVVAPEAQRRGVGSALLREGLREVDRRGWQAFIEASPAGVGLYRKFGWEEKLKMTVNFKDFGGDDVEYVSVGLIRPAGGKERV